MWARGRFCVVYLRRHKIYIARWHAGTRLKLPRSRSEVVGHDKCFLLTSATRTTMSMIFSVPGYLVISGLETAVKTCCCEEYHIGSAHCECPSTPHSAKLQLRPTLDWRVRSIERHMSSLKLPIFCRWRAPRYYRPFYRKRYPPKVACLESKQEPKC